MEDNVLKNLKRRFSTENLGKPAILGLAIVFVMVAALTAGRLFEAAAANDIEITHPYVESSSVSGGEQGSVDGGPRTVFVHVTGAVINPGLYELPEGARIAEAVEAAGGFAEDALIDSVNLARVVNDGEQIRIVNETEDVSDDGAASSQVAASAGQPAKVPGLVNVNTATADELQSLSGIGESTARKIIADREANGPFSTIDDLKRVSGIGDKKLESIRDLICV